MATAVGIQVPEGDVSGLSDAARWHAQLADELESHQQTLVGTSFRLATRWEGVAAQAYSTYSDHVVASYGAAADQAREISQTLTTWARELAADQRRSRALLAEAEAKAVAIDSVKAKLNQLHGVQGAASEVATEVARLRGLEEDLASLQRQGARIFEDAEALAARHNAYLSGIHVVPPPLLATPTPTPAPAVAPPVLTAAASGVGFAGTGVAAVASGSPAIAANVGAPAATDVPLNLTPVGSGAQQGAITFGDLEKIGAQFGWTPAQDQAWWQVIKLESGGNPAATNPTSGAYGIGQFLGNTMKEYAPYGAASANPMDQLNAMARYIHDRYGSPDAALSFHLANNWY